MKNILSFIIKNLIAVVEINTIYKQQKLMEKNIW